mgnify:CR=1 FL=1
MATDIKLSPAPGVPSSLRKNHNGYKRGNVTNPKIPVYLYTVDVSLFGAIER